MQRVKAHELRKKDEKAVIEELARQRKELAQLRVQKVSSQAQVKLSKIRVSESCVLTVSGAVCEKSHRQSSYRPERDENQGRS